MIVEFCGIPGGGKSTHIREYLEKYPQAAMLVTIDMYKRSPVIFYALMFMVRHPITFFWMFVYVSRFHMAGLFKFSLHLALRAAAKYQKANFHTVKETVFIDEGLTHLLCTISEKELSERELNRWLNRIILPDLICIAEEGTFHRFHRKDKYINPRVAKGETALMNWESAVKANVLTISKLLSQMDARTFSVIKKANASEVAEPLHDELQKV